MFDEQNDARARLWLTLMVSGMVATIAGALAGAHGILTADEHAQMRVALAPLQSFLHNRRDARKPATVPPVQSPEMST